MNNDDEKVEKEATLGVFLFRNAENLLNFISIFHVRWTRNNSVSLTSGANFSLLKSSFWITSPVHLIKHISRRFLIHSNA